YSLFLCLSSTANSESVFCLSSYSRYFTLFFNYTPSCYIYSLSLHDALPISSAWVPARCSVRATARRIPARGRTSSWRGDCARRRSEEHTSELQSLTNLVCRLLLEKKYQ